MPTGPRVVDAPQPALVDTRVAASPAHSIEPTLKHAGISIKDVRCQKKLLEDPVAWPPSFFITIYGHLARAATPA
ncbi:MAG: hypothetical protein JO318_05115 [Chloroflexi bacterium]|nr:hypothetical protein [Chloroflexota bacterium]